MSSNQNTEGQDFVCGDCNRTTKVRMRGHRETCAVCGWYDVMPEVASRIFETSKKPEQAK